MRVTFNLMNMKQLRGTSTSLSRLSEANDKVVKQRRLLNPETDPVGYVSAMNIQRLIDETSQFERNGQNATTWLTNYDNELQRAINQLSTAKNDYAVAGLNDSQSADSRRALAGDVENVFQSLMDIGNAQYLGRYFFSGYNTDTPPFAVRDNEVNAIVASEPGSDLITRDVYGDMPELKGGSYRILGQVVGSTVKMTMYDGNNNPVIIDSNGSDETAEEGNQGSTTLVAPFREGAVINTGRGVAVKLPNNAPSAGSFSFTFNYEPGSDVNYFGDDGDITTKIGFNQDVKINVTGQDVFLETNRTVKGTRLNTVNNLPITGTTLMTSLQNSNVGDADSITFSGTDHNGYRVGIAKVTSPEAPKLDMTDATVEERTMYVDYGGSYYAVTVPQEAYSDMDELVFVLNREMASATYLGAHANIAAGADPSTGTFNLQGDIEVTRDGDRLVVSTLKTGNTVKLGVKGSEFSKLGFRNDLADSSDVVVGQGKDTTFEFTYDDFNSTPISVNFTDVDFAAGTSFDIDGTTINLGIPSDQNGDAVIDELDVEIEMMAAIQTAGLFGDYGVTVTPGTGANLYDVEIRRTNVNNGNQTTLSVYNADTADPDFYKFAEARQPGYPNDTTKRVDDMLSFIEELYDHGVTARMDKGQLVVEDVRSGESRISFQMTENNEGIGHSNYRDDMVLLGAYSDSRDDEWDFTVTTTAGGLPQTRDVTIDVTDSRGNTIKSVTINDYRGEAVEIAYGVSLKVPPTIGVLNFSSTMTGEGSLSFGDMNVIEEGKNVNVFRSLNNLQDALYLNIPKSGVGAPSAWQDEDLNSTSSPYFEGNFTGNYNDLWTYEVQPLNSKSEFYVQEELKAFSGNPRYYADLDLDFDINLRLDDGSVINTNFVIPQADFTNTTEMVDEVLNAINTNPTLNDHEVHAVYTNGKIEFRSGAGTQEINFIGNDDGGTGLPLTMYALGMDNPPSTGVVPPQLEYDAGVNLDVTWHDGGGAWNNATITVPPAGPFPVTYADTTALAAAVQGEVDAAFGAGNITVGISNNRLTFTPAAGDVIVSGDPADTDNAFGFYAMKDSNTVTPPYGPASLDLSDMSEAERTLTFRYETGGSFTEESIILDDISYDDIDALLAEINTKIGTTGIPAGDVVAQQYGEKGIFFSFGGAVTNMMVQGDYDGTLGYKKAGDEAQLKIVDSSGSLVNDIRITTANDPDAVADGVRIGFDKGSLYATDRFEGVVGSGIEYEIPVLDQAETQITQTLTVVGTRQNRVDSALNFHTTLATTNEEFKAKYLGSTEVDITKSITEYTAAQQVYEAALATASRALSLSMLDFMR